MKVKKLIPAVCLLLVSAMLLGTSTYAWFSMNTTVTATNMQVKAVANQGLLINEIETANDTNWDSSATTDQSGGISLRPTSTANTSAWYTANSKKANTAAAATSGTPSTDLVSGYTTLSTSASQVAAVAGSNAERNVYYVDDNGTSGYQDGEGYYVKYTYYIKSSADAIACSTAANANNLNVAVTATGTSATADLDAALRVAVVIGTKAYIFAPVTGATTSYYVNAASTATTALTGTQATGTLTIPATTSNGMQVDIYLYFEGEDANLKTDNIIAALDNLTVSVDFSLVTNASAATDNGVAIS